jgi:hypothetical protein
MLGKRLRTDPKALFCLYPIASVLLAGETNLSLLTSDVTESISDTESSEFIPAPDNMNPTKDGECDADMICSASHESLYDMEPEPTLS